MTFQAYGIDHLSPSSCSLFAAAPAAWVLQYLFKRKGKVGAAAWRGTAVEDGIAFGIMQDGALVPDAIDKAVATFDRLAALSGDGRKDKERESIPGMVLNGIKELRPYGKPTAHQRKVELTVDGLGVPILGYIDFLWEDSGTLTDVKTLHALPSQIRTAHARQAAFYARCLSENMSPRVTYVTSKKVVTYQVDEARAHVEALISIGRTIERFLALSSDPRVLADLVVPDCDSFYYADPEVRQSVFEIWGI